MVQDTSRQAVEGCGVRSMTKVKADNKGRLTGAKALKSYEKNTQPDGTITYVPTVPEDFDEIRDVAASEFDRFFGTPPDRVSADTGIETQRIDMGTDFLPTGLVLTRFVFDADGNRIYRNGQAVKETVLIRIKKGV